MALLPPAGLSLAGPRASSPGPEIGNFHAFLRDRFRSEAEAAAYLGGPSGMNANLNAEDFSKAIRMCGYPRPPPAWDALFLQAGNGSTVRVADLVRNSGLPAQQVVSSPFGARTGPTLLSQPMAPAPVSPKVMRAVDLLPAPPSEMRVGRDPRPRIIEPRVVEPRILSPTPRTLGTRGGTYLTELADPPGRRPHSARIDQEVDVLRSEVAPLRSSVAKLAEDEASLRADSSDARAALVEARRSLAEERHERQDEVSSLSGRVNEVRKFCDDRTSRESQIREVQLSDLETRLRGFINEEKQQRLAENNSITRQVEEEARMRQSETQLSGSRTDELREAVRLSIAEESRTRLSETQTLTSRVEELQTGLRTGLAEAARARETVERAMGERLAVLDARLRDECASLVERLREECSLREAADRDADAQRVELRDRALRVGEDVNELRVQTGNRFDEERRERIDELRASLEAATAAMDQALESLREQRARATDQGLYRLEAMVRDEVARLDSSYQTIAARMAEDGSAMRTETSERVDNDRALAARLAEFDRDLNEMNSKVSQSLQSLEDLPQLRDALQAINSERVGDRAALETMCREQQSQVARLHQKVDAESRQRVNDDRRMENNLSAEKSLLDNVASELKDRRVTNNIAADGLSDGPWRLLPERDRALRPLSSQGSAAAELRARTPPLDRRSFSPVQGRPTSAGLAAPGTYDRSPSRACTWENRRWAS